MFRKTWKQIKLLVILTAIILCLPRSLFPHKNQIADNDLEYYLKLNDAEKRLQEFKDNEEALRLKIGQLDVINRSRKKFNAQPVKLDIMASRLANKISREAAENNFIGHWNMAGEKPYHRYAFAGGVDHLSENAYGEWSSEEYIKTPDLIVSLMKSGHESFMKERAPRDGHKKTIIDKAHNYVGIGYHLTGKQFRYYEEFIDRYFEFENIPHEMKIGEKKDISMKTDGNSFLYFMIIYYERSLQPLTPKEIMKKGSYDDFTGEEYKKLYGWELSRYRNGPYYKIPVSFTREGLFYIQIYSDRKEVTRPAALSTKGKTPYSGIVIKVTK